MTRTTSLLLVFSILAISRVVSAQPPPASGSTSRATQSASLGAGEKFVSIESRFSIALPTHHKGFQRLSIPTPFGPARGEAYVWQLNEGSFVAGHADASQPVDTPEVAKQVFDLLRDSLKRIAQANSGVVGPEKVFELDKHPALEQRVDLFTGTMIQRTYLVSRRIYQTLAVVKVEQREYQPMAISALDSFRVLTDADIAAKRAEEIAKAEPSPLPQTPVADRAGSDALQGNLVGRVKTVTEESQDLTGTWSVQNRKRDAVDQFDEKGNFLRREFYDYKGNLDSIRVYGYIDGSRVSRSSYIQHEYNPPPLLVATDPSKPVKQRDPRYDNKYEFKYDDRKRLIEEKGFLSNGDLSYRNVHKYEGNQIEKLSYSGSGALSSNYILLIDAKGNEVERTARDPRDGALGAKYTYTYEYDSKGNWIKRTTSKTVSKDGAEKLEPQYVDFRTISYY